MKVLADIVISPRVVEELRRKGYDAVHLLDENLHRMTDGAVLSVTEQKVRIRTLPI